MRNVRKPSVVPIHYKTMKEHTLERSRMNVRTVVKLSVEFILYETMKELILESNPMNIRKWESL